MTTEKTVDLRFSSCFIEMLITHVLVGEDGHMQPRDATIWGCRKLCDNGLADDEARKLDGVPDLPLITNLWCVLDIRNVPPPSHACECQCWVQRL